MIIAILLLLTVASIVITLSVSGYFATLSAHWRKQNEISERQGRYIADVYRHFGYGGMIHNFKNYVLRQDAALLDKIKRDLKGLNAALSDLEAVLIKQDSAEIAQSLAALKKIRVAVDSYAHNVYIAEIAAREKWPPTETDALVHVDDTEALAGLTTLRQSWRHREETARREFEVLVEKATARLHYLLLFVPFLAVAGLAVVWFVRRLTREIAQRQSAELDRRRGELMVESIGILGNGISIFDRDLKLVAFNKSFFDLLEFPPDMAKPGRPLADFFHFNAERGEYGPGDIDKHVHERVELARKFLPHRFERTRPDGTVIEVHGIPLKDNAGIVTTYTDITARKRAETALAEKERQLRTALDGMSDGIFVFDANLKYLLFNDHYVDFLDVPPHMVGIGKSIETVITYAAERGDYGTGDSATLARARLDELRKPTVNTANISVKRGERHLELRKAPMAGGGGVVIVTDVTERRRARAELDLKETQLSMTLESMLAGIMLFDKNHRLQLFNDAASELYQFPKDLLKEGIPLHALTRVRAERGDFGDGDPQALMSQRIQTYLEGMSGRYVDRVPGNRFLDAFRSPTPDGYTVVVFHDITERITTEERLRENEEQLTRNIAELVAIQHDLEVQSENLSEMAQMYAEEKERAQASERSKSEFLASMSHEIRTPMAGILGFADILSGTDLSGAQLDMVAKIKGAGQSLLTIINDILDLSKIEAGKFEIEHIDFNLASVIEDAVELVRIKADSRGLELSIRLAGTLPKTVKGDPTRLRQVLINLVGNAVKFTHVGSVTVNARHSDSEDGRYLLHIDVVDTGIGIPQSVRERLFQDFTQADASTSRHYEGTGLGLAISKRLTHLMGGEIGVESEAGNGSTFWFTLIADKATTDIKNDRHNAGSRLSVAVRPLRILVAEDNELNRQIINAVLAPLGHAMQFATSGIEAVEAIGADSAAFDLVLMDVRMPGMNGLDATRTIRQMGYDAANLPIIAVTADITENHISNYLEAGMNAFANKPIDREALLSTINEVLGEDVHVPDPEDKVDGAQGEPEEPAEEAREAVSGEVEDFLSALNAMSSDRT